jgi:hypothetical protein
MLSIPWLSLKSSPIMQEIRIQLKKKAAPGEPTPSRKEANRTWREDILGILSEDQKKERKLKNQNRSSKKTYTVESSEED